MSNFVTCFFCIYWDNHKIFILQTINVVYLGIYKCWAFFAFWANPTWLWCMILLIYCWIWFANILLRIFAPMFTGISSVQSLSYVQLFATPWIAAHQASLSITNSRSLPKLTSIESMMPSSHLILCHPLLLLPSIPPSIRVFSNESALRMRWPKYWSFTFSINPSNEHPGLISFRMDWLDILVVQGVKSLLQHHSSKASFFGAQLSL